MIFISHSHSDLNRALELERALRERSFSTWIDYLSIPFGQFFIREISDALLSASIFVLVCPKAHSFWTEKEISLALKLRAARSLSTILVYDPDGALDLSFTPDEVFSDRDSLVNRISDLYVGAVRDHQDSSFSVVCNVEVVHSVGSLDSALWLGYSDELRALDDWWCSSSRKGWISGMGGVGKTSLVATWLRVLQRFGFRHIEPIRANFISLARDENAGLPSLESWLPSTGESRRLVVVDDVDSEDDESFRAISSLAAAHDAKLLVISRREPTDLYTVLRVGGLTTLDAQRILVAAGLPGTEDSKKDLIERLGRLPLAMSMAIAYLKNTGASLADYMRKLDTSLAELEGQPLSVREKVREVLQGLSPDSIRALMVLSRQPGGTMRVSDLRDAVILRNQIGSESEQQPESLDSCLESLTTRSLIQYRSEENEVRIHRLIAAACAELDETN